MARRYRFSGMPPRAVIVTDQTPTPPNRSLDEALAEAGELLKESQELTDQLADVNRRLGESLKRADDARSQGPISQDG